MVMEAKWKVAVSAGRLPAPITLLLPSIFFTCCHLSLSTCGGREHAVSQAWHHAAAVKWDVSVASRERAVVLCMNKTLFGGVQSCVSVWVQEAEEANLKTGSATLVGNSCNQTSTKTCNRSFTSQWTNAGGAYFAHRMVLEPENSVVCFK